MTINHRVLVVALPRPLTGSLRLLGPLRPLGFRWRGRDAVVKICYVRT